MAMDMWVGRRGWVRVRVRSESLHERTLLGVCLAFLGHGARWNEIHLLESFDNIQ